MTGDAVVGSSAGDDQARVAHEVSDAERRARVVLSRIAEPGDPRMTRLVHEHGGEAILAALRRQADLASEQPSEHRSGRGEEVRVLGGDLAERLRGVDPEAELARAAERGLRFVVPGDQEWPAGLGDLLHTPLLHERGGVPVGLWCRGPLGLDEAARRAVAVVGSRSATTYGADVAVQLARSWRGRAGRPCPARPSGSTRPPTGEPWPSVGPRWRCWPRGRTAPTPARTAP